MTTTESRQYFRIRRGAVQRYFYAAQLASIVAIGIWLFGLGLVVAVVYGLTLGPWLTVRQAEALRYWLDGTTLRVDQGVFFLKQKAIPLDRITDVALTQGPLMRWCGIWGLNIQTAGTGQQVPEATLYGIVDPEQARDQLLAARDRAVAEARRD